MYLWNLNNHRCYFLYISRWAAVELDTEIGWLEYRLTPRGCLAPHWWVHTSEKSIDAYDC
jgi:hypothetical protein